MSIHLHHSHKAARQLRCKHCTFAFLVTRCSICNLDTQSHVKCASSHCTCFCLFACRISGKGGSSFDIPVCVLVSTGKANFNPDMTGMSAVARQLQEQQLQARQLVLQQQAASAVAAASKTQREVRLPVRHAQLWVLHHNISILNDCAAV